MKDYMMIFVGGEQGKSELSPEEMQANMGQWFSWMGKLQDAGIYKSGEALTPHVRRISGKDRTLTDRAGSEIKELVGGYVIVQAADMDAVAKMSEGYPDYDFGGTVEIREVMVFDK